MIYAETSEGERVSAIEYGSLFKKGKSKQSIEKELYCPGCKNRVFFKNGEQKIPHFCHYREANCQLFSEGETEAHLNGKIRLWKWSKAQGLFVEMEAWLPALQQRPDLLITLADGRKIALEYQCSPISLKKLQQRSAGYQSIGYEVLWICGVEYIPSTRLLDKHTNFFRWSGKNGYSLTCMDSETGYLLTYQSFSFNRQNKLQWELQKNKLSHLSLLDVLKISQGECANPDTISKKEESKAMKLSERFLLLRRKDDTHRSFLEKIYLKRHNLPSLPDFLFLYPTKSILFHTPTYIWKYAFLCWLEEKGEEEILTRDDLVDFLQVCQADKTIILRPILFNSEERIIKPLLAFVHELTQEGILAVIGKEMWLISNHPFCKMING